MNETQHRLALPKGTRIGDFEFHRVLGHGFSPPSITRYKSMNQLARKARPTWRGESQNGPVACCLSGRSVTISGDL